MRHVGQEFTLTPVSSFGLLPGACVLFDRLSKVVHHLVDLRLETVHFTARLDRDKAREVSVSGGSRDLSKGSDLRRQVRSHRVHVEPERSATALRAHYPLT